MLRISIFFFPSEIESHHNQNKEKEKDIWCKVIQRTGGFQIYAECCQGICFLDHVGRAFQSLGAELKKALEPNCFAVEAVPTECICQCT